MTSSQTPARDRSIDLVSALVAALAAVLVLGWASAAEAQTPHLSIQATPSPFGPGTSIAITVEVSLNVPEDSWCFPYPHPDACKVTDRYASVQVTGSNGFSDFQESWSDEASLQTFDAGPGQTLQATTYTAIGIVVLTYCRYNHLNHECVDPPQEYVEQGGPMYAVVHPIPAPSISSVSPSVTTAGTVVEVTGAHFGASGTLAFTGADATAIWQWTSTRIVASVPAGATSGAVVVTTGGQSSNGYPVTVMPHLSFVTPGAGASGQSVTLTGTGFGSSGTVTFNGTAASVSQWTNTSLTTVVPSGATSGNVVVTVAGRRATASRSR